MFDVKVPPISLGRFIIWFGAAIVLSKITGLLGVDINPRIFVIWIPWAALTLAWFVAVHRTRRQARQ